MDRHSRLRRLIYAARDLRSRALFEALRRHCGGQVLDVGGWDFYWTARRQGARFETWTTLESAADHLPDWTAPDFRAVHGDGCRMAFRDGAFDTVLSVQVLEHVFEPLRMVDEMARVLRADGRAIFLIPQTGTTHAAPHYYANFSRYWVRAALERAGLEILEHRPLGGLWSSMASHLVYFFLHAARVEGMSDPECRRNRLFYLLFPFMAVFSLVSIPVALLFSLGDLSEEPNNHLVVARKPPPVAASA